MSPAEFNRAVDTCRERLRRDPRDVDALNSLGNLLANAGHLDASQSAYEHAAAVRPDVPQLHLNLGNLLQRRGRHEQARVCFSKALELQPDYPEAWNNLGNALQDLAEIDRAIDAYRRAIELRADFPEPHNNLGLALRKLDRHADAVEAFERALDINPAYAAAIVNRGLALRSLERHAEALREFDRALQLTPNAAAVWCFKGAALMEAGDARGGCEALERSLALEPFNRTALAYRMAVMPELDENPEPPVLRDLDRHVADHDVSCPTAYESLSAFNEALARHVRAHPTLSEQAAGRATRHGEHTGNLLIGDKGPVAALEQIIAESVRQYLARPPMHPAHPYAQFQLPQWRLVAWAVVMSSGGHQIPHIHAAGWLSGVYYVRLPGCVGESAEGDAGWIEFGRPPDSLHCRAEPVTRRICPREGRLLIFPSYYYHRTIPFESEEPRISIAFDVLPTAPPGRA
ncbi:MAG: tetratricopeptide repeat protein [Gammaproteobacteria bacterium]